MKKILRLTESDLVRLVNKVIKEQVTGTNTSDVVVDCFETHFENPNMELPKSCKELAEEIINTKKIPTDTIKIMACAADLSKYVDSNVFETMAKLKDVYECIIKKTKSPVKI